MKDFCGTPIIESDHLPRGEFIVGADLASSSADTVVILMGTRPLTEVELAGRWAIWHVRSLYGADLLDWIGEDPPGDEPSLTEQPPTFLDRIIHAGIAA